MALEIT